MADLQVDLRYDRLQTLFGALAPEAVRTLLPRRSVSTLAPGEFVYRQGDPVDGIYVLLPSTAAALPRIVDVMWTNQTTGRVLRLERIAAPAVLGVVEIAQSGLLLRSHAPARMRSAAGRIRRSSARAATEVQIVRIPLEALGALEPQDAVTLAALLGLRSADAFADALAALHDAFIDDSAYRLAAWLRQEASANFVDQGAGGPAMRTPPVSQAEVAAQIGLRRDTLNQKLKLLEAAGVISVLPSREIVVHDAERLDYLADLSVRDDFAAFATARDTITDAVASGAVFRARNLALEALAVFPEHPELRHLAALATLRCGAREEARALLTAFGWDGALEATLESVRRGFSFPRGRARSADADDDEEDADEEERWKRDRHSKEARLRVDAPALAARLAKEAFFAEGADQPSAREAALEAFHRYAAIADRFGDPYCAVNAAAMAAMTADENGCRHYASRAVMQSTGKSYWSRATAMEARLLLGEYDEALALAALANVATDDEISRVGMIATTRLQLRRLGPLFGTRAEALRASLVQRRVVYLVGHMASPDDPDAAGWRALEPELAHQARQTLMDLHAGAVFCALAAGSDILLAEQAIACGAGLHVVLPTPTAEFLQRSVLIGDASTRAFWRGRFEALMQQAATITILEEDKPLKARSPFDWAVYTGARHAAGLALLLADQWESEATMLAIHDGTPPGSVAGTSRIVADWQDKGRRLVRLPCHWRQTSPARVPEPIAASSGAALFVWLVLPGEHERHQTKSEQAIEIALRSAEAALASHLKSEETLCRRVLANQMVGLYLPIADSNRALELAFAFAAIRPDGLDGLRIVLDYGAIFGANRAVSEFRLGALRASRDTIDLPMNVVVMTEVFATQARFNSMSAPGFAQIGHQIRRSGSSNQPVSASRYFATFGSGLFNSAR